MSRFYSVPEREEEVHALSDCEVFYKEAQENEDGEPYEMFPEAGWYYWYCFPGCLPEGDPMGPYKTEEEAIAACREDASEWPK